MEITWVGVGLALVITAAIITAYKLGVEVGKWKFIEDSYGLTDPENLKRLEEDDEWLD